VGRERGRHRRAAVRARRRLEPVGFNDLLSALLGAALALAGGYALDSVGVAALALGATAIVAAPVLWLLPSTRRAAPGGAPG
jgi:hypothetical protein